MTSLKYLNSSDSHPLDIIQEALDHENYIVYREQIADDISQLFVPLLVNKATNAFLMEVLLINDLSDLLNDGSRENEAQLISFSCKINMSSLEAAGGAILRLLNFLNQMLPLGYFIYEEENHSISYRCILPFESNTKVSSSIALEIIFMAEVAISSLYDLMKDVYSAKILPEDAMQIILKRGLFIPLED